MPLDNHSVMEMDDVRKNNSVHINHNKGDDNHSFTSLDLNSDNHDPPRPNSSNSEAPTAVVYDNTKLPKDPYGVGGHDHDPSSSSAHHNLLSESITKVRTFISTQFTVHKKLLKLILIPTLLILFHVYLICAIAYNSRHDLPWAWCDGLGFLLILYGICVWSTLYYFVLKFLLGAKIKKQIVKPLRKVGHPYWIRFWKIPYVQLMISLLAFTAIVIFLIIDTSNQRKRLVSAVGVLILVFIGLLLSKYPGHIQWRHVVWSIGLQFVFGLLILRWDTGRLALNCISGKVKTFLDFTAHGTDLLYGYLSTGVPASGLHPIFVFRSLSVIFFFGFMISLMYHYGAMQWIIVKLGWLLQITIGTTAAESMAAAANVFVGLVEAPLLIKPFLDKLTDSELNAVMTSGFATIAGTVLAAYIELGISASYLLSASLMAAPAALGMAKLIYPELEKSSTTSKEIKLIKTKSDTNALDAAAQGAMAGITLVACIVANIIAFVAFVAFLNEIVQWFGALVGIADLTFEVILGYLFIPVAFIIGIDYEETQLIGRLLGLKIVANEFIAYQRLVNMSVSPRSRAITTFALCSFANVASVGIQLGGLGALLSTERRGDLAKIIGRSLLGGILVGFLNACIAGCLLSEPGYAEWILTNNFTMTTMPPNS